MRGQRGQRGFLSETSVTGVREGGTHGGGGDACGLSRDGRGFLDVLEALGAAGRPDQRLSGAVRQLDVCAGAGQRR